jgi:hypothetical protein
MEVSYEIHASVALPRGKNPRYPLDKRLGGPQSGYGRGGKEKYVCKFVNIVVVWDFNCKT